MKESIPSLPIIREHIIRILDDQQKTPTHLFSEFWFTTTDEEFRIAFGEDKDTHDYARNFRIMKTILNQLFIEGTVVKLKRGVYFLSVGGRGELFRQRILRSCAVEL
jgi:hypothetical protein